MAKKRPTTKTDKVAKVSAETKVSPESLERLNLEALDALDALTPDEDELLGGTSNPDVPMEGVTSVGTSKEDVESTLPESGNLMERVPTFIGFHPITEEPIYL